MATMKMRYVNDYVDRTGKPRFYFRRRGKRTPLPGLPGSEEFMAAYQACLADKCLPAPTTIKSV